MKQQMFYISYELDNATDYDVWYLYVMKTGPYFKVGIAVNVEDRKLALQTGTPFTLKVVHKRMVHKRFIGRFEKAIHRKLKAFHHRGEWFKAEFADIKAAIKHVGVELQQWEREYRKRVERRTPA